MTLRVASVIDRAARLRLSMFVLGAALVAAGQVHPCQSNRPTADGVENDSQLCIQLTVKEGRLSVDRAGSSFRASASFAKRLSIPPTQAEEELFQEAERALGAIRPLRVLMTNEERARDARGELNDPKAEELRSVTKAWAEYLPGLLEWVSDNPERDAGRISDESELLEPLSLLFQSSPLQFNESAEQRGIVYEPRTGVLSFSVADPIDNWADACRVAIKFRSIVGGEAAKSKRLKELNQALAPLAGRLHCRSCVETRLWRFYRSRGLTPELAITFGRASRVDLEIAEAKRIRSLVFGPEKLAKDSETPKAVYILLDDADFRGFLKLRRSGQSFTVAGGFDVLNYKDHLKREPPYVNELDLQIKQYSLAQVSFAAALDPAGGDLVDLRAEALPTEKLMPERTPKPAPALADDSGGVKSQVQEIAKEAGFQPERAERSEAMKPRTRYIGAGLEYRPGQGVRAFGLAQASHLRLPFRESSVSVKAGAQENPLANLNYFADYLFFSRIHRRLSLQLNTSVEPEPARFLGGRKIDERRGGAMGRGELELFRDWSGHLLRTSLEARHATVELEQGDSPQFKQNLNTLDWGLVYAFERPATNNPLRIRVEPLARLGLGLARNEPAFRKLTLRVRYHQDFGRRYAVEFGARFDAATARTPVFELPSFGTPGTVRGFRADDALGRRLWSVQSEAWTPIPWTGDAEGGVGTFLRDRIRLALFADAGGVERAVFSESGARLGAGLGLRFVYGPVVLKFDWAYGLGSAATGGSRGKFYLDASTISTKLPF